jgi:hypothetical protein
MSDQPRQVGERLFADGITRPVFEDWDGRQYVEDEGERAYGIWLPPADEPLTGSRGCPAADLPGRPRQLVG